MLVNVMVSGSDPGYILSHHYFLQSFPVLAGEIFDSVIIDGCQKSDIQAVFEVAINGLFSFGNDHTALLILNISCIGILSRMMKTLKM